MCLHWQLPQLPACGCTRRMVSSSRLRLAEESQDFKPVSSAIQQTRPVSDRLKFCLCCKKDKLSLDLKIAIHPPRSTTVCGRRGYDHCLLCLMHTSDCLPVRAALFQKWQANLPHGTVLPHTHFLLLWALHLVLPWFYLLWLHQWGTSRPPPKSPLPGVTRGCCLPERLTGTSKSRKAKLPKPEPAAACPGVVAGSWGQHSVSWNLYQQSTEQDAEGK